MQVVYLYKGRQLFVACVMFLLLGGLSLAQDKVMPIDLTTVLKLAGSNNLDIAMINARYELAKAEQVKNKEWLIPVLTPGLILTSYNGIAQNIDGVFLDVDKNSFWAGINVAVDWDLGNMVYPYLASKQNIESFGYERIVEQNRTKVSVVRCYYDLGAAQSKLIALEKVSSKASEIVDQIELQVEQGVTYKSDLLLAKANLNHVKIEISKAQTAMKGKSYELLELLNISDNVQLLVSDSLLVPVNLVDTNTIEIQPAYEKRPEVMLYTSRIEGLQMERKPETTGLLLPRIGFRLNTGPFGPYFSPLGNELNYYIGALWNIPLGGLFFGGVKKEYDAQIVMEEVKLSQAKNMIRREIQDENMRVHTSNVRMGLAKSAVGYGREALEQSMQRQRLGTAIPLEVLRAQEQLTEAELDFIDAVTDYNKAQYSLYIALGNNLSD